MHIEMLSPKMFDVRKLQKQLQSVEWNTIHLRTQHPQSPHREVSDIWVRYNPIENYHGDMQAFNAEHIPQWYPVARQLSEAERLAQAVSIEFQALSLGAVLVTKIPPGKQVYAHVDGGWHARHFEKFAVCVQGNEKQAFHFEGESLITQPGDLWWFDNAYPHWVTNDSDEDRITLIVCIRRH
jgi:quercetin dioxygenase-like cupin family protein